MLDVIAFFLQREVQAQFLKMYIDFARKNQWFYQLNFSIDISRKVEEITF